MSARLCAACGKDLYRKKVWEKYRGKVIGYCCAHTHTFCRDGSVRRRQDCDSSVMTRDFCSCFQSMVYSDEEVTDETKT